MLNGSQKMANIMGESMDPCGIPCFIGCWANDIELLWKLNFDGKSLLNEKFLNQRGISFIALNSSVSNAEDKISSISCWDLLLASEVYKSSKSESRVVSVLCPCRKQFCLLPSYIYSSMK